MKPADANMQWRNIHADRWTDFVDEEGMLHYPVVNWRDPEFLHNHRMYYEREDYC